MLLRTEVLPADGFTQKTLHCIFSTDVSTLGGGEVSDLDEIWSHVELSEGMMSVVVEFWSAE